MAFDQRCFNCFNTAVDKLLRREEVPKQKANSFSDKMMSLYQDKKDEYSTPLFARELHKHLKYLTNNSDPYKKAKQQSNDLILGMYLSLKLQVKKSATPWETALRMAIAGNIIDFAVTEKYNISETINEVLNSEFAIDDSKLLLNELKEAKTVLYLCDNNGEIVLDKLFIETINHPNLIYAVRDVPIINDATLEDAIYVGLDKIVTVISNGYDAPSTLLDKCSDEFLDIYNKADVIISKGQGNLEGLQNNTTGNIYFLLMVKCDVIAESLKVKKGDFVIKKKNT